LLVDGRPLTDVAAILYYLAKHFPEAHLLPENDLEGEAQIISWMSFNASTVHPARRIGLNRWKEVFGIAEQRLGRRDWAVGGYSIADIHLFRLFWRFFNSLHPSPEDFPGLSAHYRRMMARPRGAPGSRNRRRGRLPAVVMAKCAQQDQSHSC